MMTESNLNQTTTYTAYVQFMMAQLNDAIRYSDSKHTVGMALVASMLLTSNTLFAKELNTSNHIIALIFDLNIVSGILSLIIGYTGIFPKIVNPTNLQLKRNPRASEAMHNIFYFQNLSRVSSNILREHLDTMFLNTDLSKEYRSQAAAEIVALSTIVAKKLFTFRLFLYAVFVYLTTFMTLYLIIIVRK